MISKRTSACLVIVLSLALVHPQPSWAGRHVLNQTSQTIEKSFGKYWTKLTLPPDALNKARIVRYTYSPNALRRVFPEFPRATLTIDYRNDRVVEIQFFPDPLNQQAHILNKPNALSVSALVQEKQVESRFFNMCLAIDRPSISL